MKKKIWIPDILYHATTLEDLERFRKENIVRHRYGGSLFLSRSEGHAWQVAHRIKGSPCVLIVDVGRAKRAKIFFEKNRHGLWQVNSLPLKAILNIQKGYQMQISAGGIPCFFSESGPQIALIQVQHHHSRLWEVSKGKLEEGESPLQAAKREVQEEMGVTWALDLMKPLGSVRFGFYTPQKEARLKEMHLYLLKSETKPEAFHPLKEEGIMQVDWFSPTTAKRKICHRSLKPIFWQIERDLVPNLKWKKRD